MIGLGAFNKRHPNSGCFSALRTCAEQPVFSPNHQTLHVTLSRIIAPINDAIIDNPVEIRPLLLSIDDGLA